MATTDPAAGLPELTTLVRDCVVSGVGRHVLLLRTDLLPPSLSREHHIRLAQQALAPLSRADRARQYTLSQHRIAISWRGEAPDRLREALEELGHLLQDAPPDAPGLPEFARLFELPKDSTALLAIATAPGRAVRPGEAPAPPRASGDKPPIDLQSLDDMEAQLAIASVAQFVRRRLVCRAAAGRFTPAWETRYLAIEEIMATLCPDRNPRGEPWLLHRLTRTLDRRMLALLSSMAELRGAGPFSLELNVASVLSPEFLRFDAGLPIGLRGHLVLDLHPVDVMADISSFRFAATFARTRGYRVLLRGITGPLLPLLDFVALDPDFIELRWSPGLVGIDPALLRPGGARWVLTGADDPAALRWGNAFAVSLFQGEAVQPDAKQPPAGLGRARAAA